MTRMVVGASARPAAPGCGGRSGSGVASGVYFVRLRAGEETRIRKVVSIR